MEFMSGVVLNYARHYKKKAIGQPEYHDKVKWFSGAAD